MPQAFLPGTHLCPEDWNSGDRLWVVDEPAKAQAGMIAPFGGHDAMVADLKAKVLPGEAR